MCAEARVTSVSGQAQPRRMWGGAEEGGAEEEVDIASVLDDV